jgi:hypothetical protein
MSKLLKNMRNKQVLGWTLTGLTLALFASGCATTGDTKGTATAATGQPSKYKLADGRTVEIGKASPAPSGGLNYKNPHLEKCWIADGFDFNGYDTLYIAPTQSTAKFNAADEEQPLQLAKENLVIELKRALSAKAMFPNIVTAESAIKPGAKVLKLENTITEYAKGGGAARYFAGLYGAGQPVLRVEGKATDAGKPLFTYEARRSGVSAGARVTGAFMKDVDIQLEDIRSMVLDLTDFMAITAKKAPLKS